MATEKTPTENDVCAICQLQQAIALRHLPETLKTLRIDLGNHVVSSSEFAHDACLDKIVRVFLQKKYTNGK